MKMTKKEQIEEMAVIGCVRNPQAHTAEECAKCDFKQGQCNAYRHAEALYSVVISREEYEMLANRYKNLEIKYSHLCDNYRLCKDANETLKQNVIAARKETAEKIFGDLWNNFVEYSSYAMAIDELLIDFDEMGFVPTTLCENPDEYARDWKKQLLVEIKRLKAENEELTKVVSSKVYDLIDNAKEIADAREAWEKQAKIEAVKEFAEELKEKYGFYSCYSWHCDTKLLSEIIDELLKEYE